jgi:uncharacterized membrane protein
MSDSPQSPSTPPPAQSGLSDTAAGALAYITIVPAIVFLALEPYNRKPYVKFHAWQSICLNIAWIAVWIVAMILAVIPIIGWILGPLLGLSLFILWLVCILKAVNGHKFMVPIIGPLAEKMANS